MSILDFAKDIGRQVFDRDDVAAENIEEMLSTKLTPIKDLSVEFDDGTVSQQLRRLNSTRLKAVTRCPV